eukprot:TRINITY_DN2185_c0_g1_i1.p1 TRINITY_DN2185_c0_g1~~TRINITY_DN2185_c0_g1_i1.p1  ORF type:complete len:309 (+),score=78.19 TRINITY_DN2185_c0_g1_i1:89-1015(+)
MTFNPKVVVVGSSNMDLISYVPHLPKKGETLFGSKFVTGFGGKGANQAVMAALLGSHTVMIGKVGTDEFGKQMKQNFESKKVDTKYLFVTDECSSGVAPIFVSEDGSNSIVVVSGANDLLTESEIRQAEEAFKDCKVVLSVLEIPVSAVIEGLKLGKKHGAVTILNPAPAQKNLPDELFKHTDIIVPNESELELLTGINITSEEEIKKAATLLLEKGVKQVVVTLGEKGCLYLSKEGTIRVPSVKVQAKDTTGAGDCFLGSFAYFLGCGLNVEESINRATKVASISVQREGTQSSYPSTTELPAEWWK